jgi:peroxiredoxin
MILRYCLVSAFVLAALPALAETAPAPNTPAPNFTGQTAQGQEISLDQFKGRIVVLEWTNKDCPFVHKMYDSGAMQALQADATAKGVEWISINSSAPGKQGAVDGKQALAVASDRHAHPSDIVLDPTGRIGHLYGAKTTPDMVVIDKTGLIAYEGAIDDHPSTDTADIPGAKNYVKMALDDLASGKPVETAETEPYGCSIKY